MARRGSVYCMANDEMPRVVKIGATLRCPEDRLNDARSTTWAPTCYRIIAQALVEDAFAAEQALHALLAHRRLEARREFFRVTHAEARALFAAVQLTSGPESAAGEADQTSEWGFASGELHGEALCLRTFQPVRGGSKIDATQRTPAFAVPLLREFVHLVIHRKPRADRFIEAHLL